MSTQQEFDDCEANIEEIQRVLAAEQDRRQEIYGQLMFERFGVKKGIVVLCRVRGKDKKECIVDSVDADKAWAIKPWLNVRVKTKSGEWSKSVQAIFSNWELQ